MVVMLLISIIMAVAVPRFDGGILQNSQKITTRQFMNIARTLRARSIGEQKTFALVIDVSGDRYWVVDESMDELAMSEATEKAHKLPSDIHFTDVTFPNRDLIRSGNVEIQFHPAGFADQALIHLETDNAQRFSYMVEPLLPKIKVADQWIQF